MIKPTDIPILFTEADGGPMSGNVSVKPEVLEAIQLAQPLLREAGITGITIRMSPQFT